MKEIVTKHLLEGCTARQDTLERGLEQILSAGRLLIEAARRQRCIYLFGNGGSAADAQHIEAELVARYLRDRPPIRARALGTNVSTITAVANDTDFREIFARQLELSQPGDVAVGISTSGSSANVIRGLETAKHMGAATIALTGIQSGPVAEIADVWVAAQHESTPLVQELHISIGHVWCHMIESHLYG